MTRPAYSTFFGEKLNIAKEVKKRSKPVTTVYVSSYVPRKCGIATYTKELTNGINALNPLRVAQIVALNNKSSEQISYPHEVISTIKEDDQENYLEAATSLNKKIDLDVVSLQHEFGIFGPRDGELVLNFSKSLKVPIISTLHTVLENPTVKQRNIIENLCKVSTGVVVMLAAAADILTTDYGVDVDKIVVIPHGVPDFPVLDTKEWKARTRLSDRTVMSSINLISPSRGFEYAISAVPEIVKKIPNFLYLVIGETHPVYLQKAQEDPYRQKLEKLVKDLGMQEHIKFINKYVSLNELVSYIGASDFYVTPYLDPQQAASGALAYAIGAGKVCVSTPYLYAKEVLSQGRGLIVPFADSRSIASLIKNLNPKERQEIEKKVYELGRTMTWTNVAYQYFQVFNYVADGYK